MKRIVCDIECNGLLNKLDRIWCAVTTDLDTGETLVFSDYSTQNVDGNTTDFINHLNTCDEIIGHNFIGYDEQAIKLVTNTELSATIIDTLLMSRLLKFNRLTPKGCRGNHSLEAWGVRLKIAKPEQNQWKVWEESMLNRCKEDVKINVALYEVLLKEVEAQPGVQKALDIEHKVAYVMVKQRNNGWLLDIEKVNTNIEYLDIEIERLRSKLEPQIPMRCVPKDPAATWEQVNEAMDFHWNKVPKTRIDHKGKPVKTTRMPKKVKFIKDGRYDTHTARWFGIEQTDAWTSRDYNGYYSRVEFKKVKLAQHKFVKDFLLSIGWIPTSWNYKKDAFGKILKDDEWQPLKASPKLTIDSLDSIPGDFGSEYQLWATLTHRRLTLCNPKDTSKGWLNIKRPDGHVECDPNTIGAATGRMTHRGIVNVPGAKSIFGQEMRECFIAQEGRVLIGADSAGAQLRLLAGAMKDQDYLDTVINGEEEDDDGNFKGTDVHTANGLAAGFISSNDVEFLRISDATTDNYHEAHTRFVKGRALSKNFIYALLFGAGNPKIGALVGGGAKAGKLLREKFLRGFPKLKVLIQDLEDEFKENKKRYKQGFIMGLDGRRVYLDSEHKLLNYKLQGDEAIVMKYTLVLADSLLANNSVDAKLLCFYHDELNYELPTEAVPIASKILKHAFIKAAEHLNVGCKMETTPKIGNNWYDIH